MKIGFVSLGCSKNLVDTQLAMGFLKAQGHQFVDQPQQADVIVINTCGFIESAKEESINTILRMAEYKQNKCQKLVVMGCLVQRYKDELIAELPEVDRFITIDEYPKLADIFSQLLNTTCNKAFETVIATKPWTAYLRIADGCSHRCAYCAIPLIRHNHRSEKIDDLENQAKQLAQMGVKELNLVAQDSTFYGYDIDHQYHLDELLKRLDTIEGLAWIRILYMYPGEITPKLLDAMESCHKVIPYFDIPVQHGSNKILKLMNRPGNITEIANQVSEIRSRFPQAVMRTTMMVGFPGEQEEDFQQLLAFVRQIQWDRLGGFVYSREENTPAYDRLQVDKEVAERRLDQLMVEQQKISAAKSEAMVGQVVEVLIETKDALRNYYQGRSWRNAPDDIDGHIRFTAPITLQPGSIVKVKITNAKAYDLQGEYQAE